MKPLQAGDPERIGRFLLRGRLGVGGMGRVYLGETAQGEQAAIKVIREELAGEPGFRQRFRREVAAASAVAGMFTARVLDADPDADPPWLATQFVDGPTLQAAVRNGGPLPEATQQRLARELAEALSAIHAAGLVHRDLKPANVLLSPGGAKVIDFGIAQAVDSTRLTTTGVIIGTPEYMAPEQVINPGESGPAADVFALGATLAFAASGRSPFATDQPASTLYRIVNLEPDLAGVPASTASIARACLAKNPTDRPAPAALAARLRGDRREPATEPAPTRMQNGPAFPTGPPPARPRTRIRPAAVAAVAVVATVAAVTSAIIAFRPTTSTAAPPAPPTTTAVAAADSPQARYVDRLCASGDLLTNLGDTATAPVPTTDLAVTRRNFLSTADRTIGVVEVALADFTALRDDAPNADVKAKFGLIVDEFTSARRSFGSARDGVAASNPLQLKAYSTGVKRYADGVRNIALAAQLVKGITLPPDYTAATPTAPRCND